MPRKRPTARERLSEAMDDRRVELRLRWRDVAGRSRLTTQTLLAVRTGDGDIRRTTQRSIEEGLRWEAGSIKAVLDGGDPVPLPDAPVVGADRAPTVLESIDADPYLLPEAKLHLRNQYGLLLRINQEARAAVAGQLDGRGDDGLEEKITAETDRIRGIKGLTSEQIDRLVKDKEDELREAAAAAAVRVPPDRRDTVLGDSLDDLDLDEADVEAAGDVSLGEKPAKQRR